MQIDDCACIDVNITEKNMYFFIINEFKRHRLELWLTVLME